MYLQICSQMKECSFHILIVKRVLVGGLHESLYAFPAYVITVEELDHNVR